MLDRLRRPFFIIAIILILLTVLIEVGSVMMLGNAASGLDRPTPGMGIFYMALVDGLLLYTTLLVGSSLVIPERVQGRVQGIATFIVGLIVLLLAIASIFIAIALVILMVTLLLAIPFGTLVYLAIYGSFETGAAEATLGLLMTLKMAYAVFMIAAHQRFLQNKGLVLLYLTSLLCNIILNFLHGFVPGFLVSITDGIGAIVVTILAILWAIFFLVGSLIAVIKALGGIVFIVLVIVAVSLIGSLIAFLS